MSDLDDVVLTVDDDYVVRDVEGPASLAVAMHIERRIMALRREVEDLYTRMVDVFGAATHRLAANDDDER